MYKNKCKCGNVYGHLIAQHELNRCIVVQSFVPMVQYKMIS